MSTKTELTGLVGEDEARRLLETVDWLDEALKLKGVAYKAADLDRLLAGLSEADLQRLYARIGKILAGPQSQATDTEGRKVIKLLGPKPTKQPALSRSFEAGIADIEADRTGVAQKNLAAKTAMDRDFDEGMLEIAKARGMVIRQTKGRPGRFGGPDFEITAKNIAGIREILEWRQKNQQPAVGRSPSEQMNSTVAADIEEIEEYRRKQRGGG